EVGMRCWLCLLVASTAAAIFWISADAWAQQAPGQRTVRKRAGRARVVKVDRSKPVVPVKGPRESVPSQVVTTTEGNKAKVFAFGALDIDGKLKAPQLLYFLNRVKGEFDDSTLD